MLLLRLYRHPDFWIMGRIWCSTVAAAGTRADTGIKGIARRTSVVVSTRCGRFKGIRPRSLWIRRRRLERICSILISDGNSWGFKWIAGTKPWGLSRGRRIGPTRVGSLTALLGSVRHAIVVARTRVSTGWGCWVTRRQRRGIEGICRFVVVVGRSLSRRSHGWRIKGIRRSVGSLPSPGTGTKAAVAIGRWRSYRSGGLSLVSQPRRFRARFGPSLASARIDTHSIVYVCLNSLS